MQNLGHYYSLLGLNEPTNSTEIIKAYSAKKSMLERSYNDPEKNSDEKRQIVEELSQIKVAYQALLLHIKSQNAQGNSSSQNTTGYGSSQNIPGHASSQNTPGYNSGQNVPGYGNSQNIPGSVQNTPGYANSHNTTGYNSSQNIPGNVQNTPGYASGHNTTGYSSGHNTTSYTSNQNTSGYGSPNASLESGSMRNQHYGNQSVSNYTTDDRMNNPEFGNNLNQSVNGYDSSAMNQGFNSSRMNAPNIVNKSYETNTMNDYNQSQLNSNKPGLNHGSEFFNDNGRLQGSNKSNINAPSYQNDSQPSRANLNQNYPSNNLYHNETAGVHNYQPNSNYPENLAYSQSKNNFQQIIEPPYQNTNFSKNMNQQNFTNKNSEIRSENQAVTRESIHNSSNQCSQKAPQQNFSPSSNMEQTGGFNATSVDGRQESVANFHVPLNAELFKIISQRGCLPPDPMLISADPEISFYETRCMCPLKTEKKFCGCLKNACRVHCKRTCCSRQKNSKKSSGSCCTGCI